MYVRDLNLEEMREKCIFVPQTRKKSTGSRNVQHCGLSHSAGENNNINVHLSLSFGGFSKMHPVSRIWIMEMVDNDDIIRQSLAGKHQSSILTKLGWHHSRLLHTKTNLFENQTKKN